MTTLVGRQDNFESALKELVELEYDAVEAYEAAINRLEDNAYKAKVTSFKEDHLGHIKEVSELLKKHNEKAATGPDLTKQWLAKGKVVMAGLIGDLTILKALRSNEIDTNTAYERMKIHENIWPDAKAIIQRGLADEHKHKSWLDSILDDD